MSAPFFTVLRNTVGVRLPPSVPLHFLRSALVSLQIESHSPLSQVVTCEARYRVGLRWPVAYNTVVLAVPCTLTLALSAQQVVLDGTADWAIFQRRALAAHCGETLSIRSVMAPTFVSRALRKRVGGARETGLPRLSSLDFVTGRGEILIGAKGEIVELDLAENEHVLVDRSRLLALRVNGINGIASCLQKSDFGAKKNPGSFTNRLKGVFSSRIPILPGTLSFAQKTWDFLASSAAWTKDLILSKPKYVTIHGPTKVFLETGDEGIPTQRFGKFGSGQYLETKKEDMLSYVKIENGKAVFESTKDFGYSKD